jgi:hypothetical protein
MRGCEQMSQDYQRHCPWPFCPPVDRPDCPPEEQDPPLIMPIWGIPQSVGGPWSQPDWAPTHRLRAVRDCCCRPNTLCLWSKTQPTVSGIAHSWSFDLKWDLNMEGEGREDVKYCDHELWERTSDDTRPRHYLSWDPRQWNAAHRNHTFVPALFGAFPGYQRQKCGEAGEGKVIHLDYSDTPSFSPAFPWTFWYLEIFFRISSGCPGNPPCCVMILIVHQGMSQAVYVRGPVCAMGCNGLPLHRVRVGSALPESWARNQLYTNNIGEERRLGGLGISCSS